MKGVVISLEGKKIREIEIPDVFDTPYRPDIIKRAVVASEANRRQPYGPNKKSGMRHAVSTWGKGRGTARVQRLTQGRTAAESPNNVGGRRAHPPRVEKIYHKKINKKENTLARFSSFAATGNSEIISSRNHKFDDKLAFPIIIEDAFEGLMTTKDAVNVLDTIGVGEDLERAKKGKHIRAGRGTMRGRKYKIPKSVLVVCNDDSNLQPSLRNLPGVDVIRVENVSTSDLAPGGLPGRLTVYTESAIRKIGGDE